MDSCWVYMRGHIDLLDPVAKVFPGVPRVKQGRLHRRSAYYTRRIVTVKPPPAGTNLLEWDAAEPCCGGHFGPACCAARSVAAC